MTCAKRNTRTQGEQIRRITALLTYVVSGIAILVGLVMQCWCVARRGVWFDESFTIRMVGFAGSEMLTRISLDHTPPLHYVLLKGWMAVAGTSLYAFRMPSLFSGLAIVVGAYCLTGRLYRDYSTRREGALLSAALCSLLPLLIDASTECRMYSLMAALSVLSAYALVRAIDESSSLWWAAYGLLVVLLVYTHYFGLFLLCGHATGVVWQLIRRLRSGRRADSLRLASAASLTAVVCAFALAPLVPTFLQQRAQVQGGFWIPPLTATRLASTAHEVVARPFSQEPAPTSELILASVAVLLVPFSLALRPSHRDVVVLLLLLAPPVAGAAVSMLDVPVWNARYLSGTVALWSVAAGGATLRISDDLVRRGIQCAVLALCAMSALDFVDYLTDEAQNGPRTAAELLDARRNAQEPVFCTSPFVYVPTIYCAQHSENWKLVALADYPHFVGTAVLTPEMYCDRACVTRVASSAERVWTVGTFEPRPHWLAQEWVVETEQRIKDRHRTILVRSFRKRGGR